MEEWIRGPVIGLGSTSFVSLCFSPSSGQVLAVKSTDLSNSASLRMEAELLSKLSSSRVVEFKGFEIRDVEGRPTCDLFMEYAPRGTLRDQIRLRSGRIKESEVRVFVREILLGLEYVHGEGIAHCDIKTQNILVTDGGLKIADFGCAKVVDNERAAAAAAASGYFAGTPAYMSPEAARWEDQSYAADVWSVGCMVIEMAMGSLPWMDADDPVSALYRIGYSDEVPEPPHWLTEPARDFVRKCLIRDFRMRPSVKELLKHQFILEPNSDYESGEQKRIGNLANGDSPNGVLEPRLWESMESSAASSSSSSCESDILCQPLHSACERIEELMGGCRFPGWGQPNWGSEDEWITVRAHQDEETKEEGDGSHGSPENVRLASEYSLEDSLTIVNDVSGNSIKEITVVCDGREDSLIISHLDSNEDGVDLDWCKKLSSSIRRNHDQPNLTEKTKKKERK